MEWATMQPYIQIAADKEIIPAIGQAFYDTLNTAYNGAGVSGTELIETFRRIRSALAYYAIYYALPQLNMRLGDAGAMETTHDGATPVRQWTFNLSRWETLKLAASYLDSALAHMEEQVVANNTAYDTWKNSPAFTQNRELLIPNARVFQEYYNINTSHRAYARLRAYIRKAELLYLRPSLCNTLYDTVSGQQAANTLTTANQALIPYMRRYLAEVTVMLAGADLNIASDGDGWRIGEHAFPETLSPDVIRTTMQALITQAETNAAKYLQDLKDVLYANLDDYPLFRDSQCNELKNTDSEDFYYPAEDESCPEKGAFLL